MTTTAPSQAAAPVGNKLPFWRKLGFGIGDFGLNLFWQMTSLYLLYYYTDVVGLPPATAGWIFGAALLWDAVCDPIVGYIASRTRSRWGAYRPYLLFGCIPLALSFVAMFVPTELKDASLLAFVLITHAVFRITYTVLSMPYNSLMATLTNDSLERGSLAAFRMFNASTAALLVALTTLTWVRMLGQGDAHRGFLLVAMLYGALSIPVFLLTFASTKEHEAPAAHRLTVREAWLLVTRNRAFFLLCGLVVAQVGALTFFSKTLPYVLKYLYLREDLIGPSLGLVAVQALIAVPFWLWVMRRTSKRTVALCGGLLGTLCFGLLGISGPPSLVVLLVVFALIGVASAAVALAYWAMLPDTVEYGEWNTHVCGGEGVISGVFTFAHKLALAIAVAAVGRLLASSGYAANQAQTSQTSGDLYAMLWQAPLCFVLIGMGFIVFYPLSRDAHAAIVKGLRQRMAPELP